MLSAVIALACADTSGATELAGSAAPFASVVPATVDFGSVQLPLSSDPTTVTLTNSGTAVLALSRFGIASSSANPSDFVVVPGGTCTLATPLAAGGSCTVLVRFRPTALGTRSGLLSFWDNTAAVRTNVALAGTATPPAFASTSVAGVDFGSVALATASDPVTVTLTNEGAGNLVLSRFGIASSSTNPSDFVVAAGGTCALATPLAAGETCTVLVRFRPTALGVRSGLLSFWDNTPAVRTNVALTGVATPASDALLSPGSVDLGSVQVGSTGGPATVTLTNTGGGTLSFWRFGIASSSANPGDFGVVAGGTCSVSVPLAPGETCTVLVRFRPTATGSRTGLLSFWDNTFAARHDAALTGVGLPGPAESLSSASVDFGLLPVGTWSAPATVTVTNSGGGVLSFWRFGIATSSVNASDFAVVSGGTCAVSLGLQNGDSCTVVVRFRPTASGARSGLLSFWDDTLAGRLDVALGGSGDDPCVGGCF